MENQIQSQSEEILQDNNNDMNQKLNDDEFIVIRIHGDSCSKVCQSLLSWIRMKATIKNIIIIAIFLLFIIGLLIHWLQCTVCIVFTISLGVYELIPLKCESPQKKLLLIFFVASILCFSFSFIGFSSTLKNTLSSAAGSCLGLIAYMMIFKQILKTIKKIKKETNSEEEFQIAYQAFKNEHCWTKDYCFLLILIGLIGIWLIGIFAHVTLFIFLVYTIIIMTFYDGLQIRNLFGQIFKKKRNFKIALFLFFGFLLQILSSGHSYYRQFNRNVDLALSGMLYACAISLIFIKKIKDRQAAFQVQQEINQEAPISFNESLTSENIVKQIGTDAESQKPLEQPAQQ